VGEAATLERAGYFGSAWGWCVRLVPMVPVRHLPRSVVFYEQLGFVVEHRRDDWGWAMLTMDGCQVMLDQSIRQGDQATSGVLYLYPDDVAAFRAAAVARGLALPEVEATFYGHAELRIEDPDGNRLWIGQVQA
jgi:uncharacterized glyoxalase superfamily protein PhnB